MLIIDSSWLQNSTSLYARGPNYCLMLRKPRIRQQISQIPRVFFQLSTICQHIALTKDHMDELNARFAAYESPEAALYAEASRSGDSQASAHQD